jgi:hypothetical protein
MIDADRPKFVECMAGLACAFGREITQAGWAGLWMGLCDLELADVQRAVLVAIRTSKFWPAVAELRELAGVLPPQARAAIAWDSFAAAVLEFGGYRSVAFDDAALTATVRSLGGWQRLCAMNADEFDRWLRKDFERLYQIHAACAPQSNPILLGTVDATSGRAAAPALIECGGAQALLGRSSAVSLPAELQRVGLLPGGAE